MLMIRLQRIGRRHDPSYRIVVTEKTAGPKAGKYVEELGHYDARLEKGKDVNLKPERAKYWLSMGAQASGTVHNIFVREGIVSGKKRDVRPAKVVQAKQEVKQETKEEVAPTSVA
ncbi:MAG: 30S ribosomal protein S16 [Patescibacteria group bacterium]